MGKGTLDEKCACVLGDRGKGYGEIDTQLPRRRGETGETEGEDAEWCVRSEGVARWTRPERQGRGETGGFCGRAPVEPIPQRKGSWPEGRGGGGTARYVPLLLASFSNVHAPHAHMITRRAPPRVTQLCRRCGPQTKMVCVGCVG